MVVIETVPNEMSKYFYSKPIYHVILTEIPSIAI